MGLPKVAGWFGSLGVPSTLGYIVAYLELLGGIALIIGIGTRYVAAGYEMDIAYLLVAIYLVFGGEPGYSVDSALTRGKTRRA
ncbi:hypothetical protein PASE110613_05760 [Paenibacillus sediminis]|uniref:Membrane protein YphA (DoxX/SURF4 family) n=2 Tax=Paenibacillus sediminis TaxID=664909 RepID=A0ABS4H183_9BACL|nr:putative membrane protein YphA (DoxX/SURF4 family) [Paenibacillus sediminis]